MRPKLLTAFGETKSVAAWSKDPRCNVSRSGLRRRLAEGWSVEEALSAEGRKLYEAFDETKTLKEWSLDDRCLVSFSLLVDRIYNGWDITRALCAPVEAPARFQAFGESKTLAEWSRDARCLHGSSDALSRRVRGGWSLETALSEPVSRYGVQIQAFDESKTMEEWVSDKRSVVNTVGTLWHRLNKMRMKPEEAISSIVEQSSSEGERQLGDFVAERIPIGRNVRHVIDKELDIFIPSLSMAIEYNGLWWHREEVVGCYYHRDKRLACDKVGVRLIQVWEDDYLNRRSVVESMILHKIGLSEKRRVYARDCKVVWVRSHAAAEFLDQYHLQGGSLGSQSAGLFDPRGGLVAVMSVKRRREGFELTRFATSDVVVGGHNKLLQFFRKRHQVEIVTFADLCVSDGGVYEQAGFVCDKELPPDYSYIANNERVHKSRYRKSRFESDSDLKFDPDLTERELADLNGIHRIWDAGKLRFVLSATT